MKLTLNLEPELIKKIKELAKKRKTSVSKMAEDFLREIEIEEELSKVKGTS